VAGRSSASPRPAATSRPATAITSTSPRACATAFATWAAFRSNSRSIRSRRPASGPTAGLDRNLAYLSVVESLYGYFFDGVVLTTGCDKTTPAMIMAAATVNIPRDRAVGRADARRGISRAGSRARARSSGTRARSWRRDASTSRSSSMGRGQRALGRPLQHHGHGAVDELDGRGARPVAAGLRGDSRPVP